MCWLLADTFRIRKCLYILGSTNTPTPGTPFCYRCSTVKWGRRTSRCNPYQACLAAGHSRQHWISSPRAIQAQVPCLLEWEGTWRVCVHVESMEYAGLSVKSSVVLKHSSVCPGDGWRGRLGNGSLQDLAVGWICMCVCKVTRGVKPHWMLSLLPRWKLREQRDFRLLCCIGWIAFVLSCFPVFSCQHYCGRKKIEIQFIANAYWTSFRVLRDI